MRAALLALPVAGAVAVLSAPSAGASTATFPFPIVNGICPFPNMVLDPAGVSVTTSPGNLHFSPPLPGAVVIWFETADPNVFGSGTADGAGNLPLNPPPAPGAQITVEVQPGLPGLCFVFPGATTLPY